MMSLVACVCCQEMNSVPLAMEFRTAMQTSMYVARASSTGVVPILGDTVGLVAYEPCIHFFFPF